MFLYLAIIFGAAAAAAHFGAVKAAGGHDDIVSGRRWETSTAYPDRAFIDWVRSGAPSLKGYARVLAPYDICLLIFLGAALACGSLAAAQALQWPPDLQWALLAAPLAFSAADMAEDRRLLTLIAAGTATIAEVGKLKAITRVKFAALSLAAAQTGGLALLAIVAAP
jgi:hypothetical protein